MRHEREPEPARRQRPPERAGLPAAAREPRAPQTAGDVVQLQIHAGNWASPLARKRNPSLSPQTQRRLEATLGSDLSGVRLHADSRQAAELGVDAYAQGEDVHFAPGRFAPDTLAGQQLLGHELAHVLQQREGRVGPTRISDGVAVNEDPALEAEAALAGRQAAAGAAPARARQSPVRAAPSTPPRQFHHRAGTTDPSPDDAEIYVIRKQLSPNKYGPVLYVGQVCKQRGSGQRFVEHVTNDSGYPWWIGHGHDYSGHDSTWPYAPTTIEDLKQVTRLETCAAEQFWWEHHGGLTGNLLNTNQPLTKKTFTASKTAQTFRGTAVGFPSNNWEPKQ